MHYAVVEVHQGIEKHRWRCVQAASQNRLVKAQEFHNRFERVNYAIASGIAASFETLLCFAKAGIQEIEGFVGSLDLTSRLPRFRMCLEFRIAHAFRQMRPQRGARGDRVRCPAFGPSA